MFQKYNKELKFEYLKVNNSAIEKFCQKLDLSKVILPAWKEEPFLVTETENDINFLFLINALNFSYWSAENEPKWVSTYKGNTYSGSFALFASLKKAFENNYPIFNPNYLKNISEEDLKAILCEKVEIPMFKERLEVLRAIGSSMLDNQINSFTEILKVADTSAIKLIELLAKLFPSFRDEAYYQGSLYPFYKRAQLIPAMLYGRYNGKKEGFFYDIDQLIIFADYRVPQTLRKLGLIDYSDFLSKKLENKEYLEVGSKEELEIRISSILASKSMLKILKEKYNYLNSLYIDYFLWKEGKSITFPAYDFHRTRTIFY